MMYQNQLINAVLDWERRLEIEEERRKNHRFVPYSNGLAPVQSNRKEERQSIFARIFKSSKERQPDYRYNAQEPCQDAEPC